MAVIHQNFVNLMDRLVKKHGRDVQIRRQTGTTLVDPARPELGSEPSFEMTSVKAVFLDADMRDLFLSLPGEPDQRTLVAREIDRLVFLPAKGLPFEVTVAETLVDGSKTLELTQAKKIQPGPTLIGYVLQTAR